MIGPYPTLSLHTTPIPGHHFWQDGSHKITNTSPTNTEQPDDEAAAAEAPWQPGRRLLKLQPQRAAAEKAGPGRKELESRGSHGRKAPGFGVDSLSRLSRVAQ
eukprot:729630-Hanusia_phi.AAC.1